MSAWCDVVPLWWMAEQTNDPARTEVAFRHVAGPTRGMEVAWSFTPLDEHRTRVAIVHRLAFAFPFGAPWLERHLVSGYFIGRVAGKTLACIKQVAEAACR